MSYIWVILGSVIGIALTSYQRWHMSNVSFEPIQRSNDPYVFLIAVNLVFLLLGSMIDTVPILLVFVPLLMPTVESLGIDPVHFGVITVFNLLIGLITPPYGLTMYLLCRISNIQITEFWKYMWPIFLAMVATLLAVTFYPPLTMWLPNQVMPVK